jgi:hypothetical protein
MSLMHGANMKITFRSVLPNFSLDNTERFSFTSLSKVWLLLRQFSRSAQLFQNNVSISSILHSVQIRVEMYEIWTKLYSLHVVL